MPIDPVHSKMAILGHPIHPMLIHFPVAALVGLIGTDLAYVLTGEFFWARAGLWLAGVGALGGWVSGIVGLLDLVLVARIRRQVTGWCHAVLAIMVLSLASLNWLLRFIDSPETYIVPGGIYLSLVTGGLISLTSYFGGRLVYDYAIGVDIRGAVGRHTTARAHEPPQG